MAKMTIKEVARLANVSISAVSFVINNKKGVSQDTREKVQKIIEQYGYTPNPNSRRLIFNKTNNIVVLFKKNAATLENYFYTEINNVILHECETRGYNLIFASIEITNNEFEFPNVIKSYDADGIIFYGDIDAMVLNGLIKYNIPYIVIDSHTHDSNFLSVTADYESAAYTAMMHLVELGHRSIAYIASNFLANLSAQTFSGYKKAIEDCGLVTNMSWIQMDAWDEQASYDCMKNILKCDTLPTAVFCSSDIYAISAIQAIKDAGLRIPEDISIISIDDIILSRYTDPKLSTVKIDKIQMGYTAMDLLMKKIQGETVLGVMMDSGTLIVRESTRRVG
jgi:DNA-binding LacI/PurR family transcriptional regulator